MHVRFWYAEGVPNDCPSPWEDDRHIILWEETQIWAGGTQTGRSQHKHVKENG